MKLEGSTKLTKKKLTGSRHRIFSRRRGLKMSRNMVDYSSQDSPYRSYEQHGDEYSPHIEDSLRCLKA